MNARLISVLTASAALAVVCCTSSMSSALVRNGGAHFGGAHFGGAHFGGAHFGGAHFGGAHFGGARLGGHNFAAEPRFGGRSNFNRNVFGNRGGWHRWGGRGVGGEPGWGYRGWGAWGGGWAGPVFWPFMYGDVFSSTLWPSAYDYDPFWSYGADVDPDYGGDQPDYSSYGTASFSSANETPPSPAVVTQSCGGFAPGVTDLPVEQIRKEVHPTREQTALLYELAAAASRANTIVDRSCPSEVPLTTLGRFEAMQKRLNAMIKAIQIVRPAFAAFYDALSADQRHRLEAVGAEEKQDKPAAAVAESSGNGGLVSLCQRHAANFTKPVQHIEQVIQPSEQQQAGVDELKRASAKAAEEIATSCPQQIAENPVARLDAMSKRLEVTDQAIQIVLPPLAALYASLSDEQKARFDSGRLPTQAGDRVKVGTLQCNLASTVGLLVASRQRLSCTYHPEGSSPAESYFGHLTTVGIDIGVNGGGRMIWAVFAPTARHDRGALAGTYVGVSADAALGVGLGANALVGGSQRSIALQPLSVEANTGVDLSAGISELRLHRLR